MKALQNLRRKVGAMIGGFEGGLSARRLKTFQPSRAHVNTLIQAAGADMTARARYLIRNNGYAANAVESWAGNAVGTGIKPSSGIADAVLKDRVQRLWLRWTDESDAEGLTDFYGQQRRAARELFIAGEVFFRIRPRRPEDGLSVPLQLQMLPAEMLPLNHNQQLENGHRIRQGIEFDRIGRRVAYHFLRRHPGDITDPGLAGETVRVTAESVLHIVDPVDAGQLRGVSRFSPALVKLFLLHQYDDAELDRKKVAAMFVGFVRRPERDFDNGGETDDRGEPLLPLEPGQLQILDDGEDITFSTPADVGGNYESFQYRTLLQVAAALGTTRHARAAEAARAARRRSLGCRCARSILNRRRQTMTLDLLQRGREVLAAQGFSALLGAQLQAFEPGRAELSLPVGPQLLQQHGFVHGGVLSYLADNALTYAGGSVLGTDVLTSEFKINYLRPATGEALHAVATVVGAGKTQAVCRCEVYAEADGERKLCAAAQGTIRKMS